MSELGASSVYFRPFSFESLLTPVLGDLGFVELGDNRWWSFKEIGGSLLAHTRQTGRALGQRLRGES